MAAAVPPASFRLQRQLLALGRRELHMLDRAAEGLADRVRHALAVAGVHIAAHTQEGDRWRLLEEFPDRRRPRVQVHDGDRPALVVAIAKGADMHVATAQGGLQAALAEGRVGLPGATAGKCTVRESRAIQLPHILLLK